MGGVRDILFGSTEDPSVSQASTLTGGQRNLLDELTQILQGQMGQGVPSYEGELTAGPSDLQTQSWDTISNLLSGISGNQNTSEAINRIFAGSEDVPGAVDVQKYEMGEFDPSAVQDWYEKSLVAPAMQTWEDKIAPAVQEKFIGQNAGSSGAANRAIAGSAADMMTNLNAELSNALYGEKQAFDTRKYGSEMDYIDKLFSAESDAAGREFTAGQSDLDRILNVPGMESNYINSLLNTIGAAEAGGSAQRSIEQGELSEDFQKWLSEQSYNNPWLTQFMNSALGTGAVENVVNPGSQSEGLLQSVIMPLLRAKMSSGADWGDLFSW